jgi:hypothetical protein
MKKLVLLLSVLVFAVPASAEIFSDNFNTGWAGPDSIGSDSQNRLPINWDRSAANPGSAFMLISTRGLNDNAMVLSQWGTDCAITTFSSFAVSDAAPLTISVETRSEGWGWHLTGLVNGIFSDASGNSLGLVSVPLTDIANEVYITETTWTTRNVTMDVPAGAASVKFQIANPYGTTGTNGGIWFDNFAVTPEPMTVCLLGLGALLIRRSKA